MSISLTQILELVGKLDDSDGDLSARERFRRYLRDNVKEVSQLRDYIEESLRNKGDQYNRSLQDLVNHLGSFLGFEVKFGRYQGTQGQIGFDGRWKSPTGFSIVVEVKTTEVYAIKTATLERYIAELISDKMISDRGRTMGLYVIGRSEPEIRQLENAIIAEKSTGELRIISADSLLSLAETMDEYDVSHDDILAILRPSGPRVDVLVDLIARLVSEEKETEEESEEEALAPQGPEPEGTPVYWLTPVRSEPGSPPEEPIQRLVGQEYVYAFGERTPGRKRIKAGDWICFYASTKGVVAHARVASPPEKKPHPKVKNPDKYPWVFRLDNIQLYLDEPVVLDAGLRNRLDAFKGGRFKDSWGFFVQSTRDISKKDFDLLTRQEEKKR